MKYIYLLIFTFLGSGLFAQPGSVIFSEDMGDPGDSSSDVNSYEGYQNYGILNFFGTAFVESNEPSTGYPDVSAGGNISFNAGQQLRISGISTLNFAPGSLSVSFGLYKDSDESDGTELVLEYSSDGINFNSLSFAQLPIGAGTAGWYYISVTIPQFPIIHNLPNIFLRFRNTTPVSDPIQFRIDDVSMEGLYFVPTISPSDTSFSLPLVVVGEFDSIEYTVSATYLIQDVEIESLTSSFEIYNPANGEWGPTLTLLKSGLGLEGDTVTVLVRHSPIEAIGDEIGVFRHSTFGGPDTIVRVYGTSIATEPLEVTNSFTATALSTESISLTWNGGDGNRRLIVARETLPVEWVPTDAVPPLPANENFSIAPEINGNKLVYDGIGSNTIIFGLNPSTTYHFTIFEYNVGTDNSQNYLTDDFLTDNERTLDGPPGLQIENVSTAYLINFQEEVPNVLNGAFNGGMSPAGLPGKLNTSSWRIGLNQNSFSSYYGEQPGQVYGWGLNNGSTGIAGIYPFQTGNGNIALGVKPTLQGLPSNYIFSSNQGGFFELSSRNKTQETIMEAYVSFVYYVYNNTQFSTKFTLSYSNNSILPGDYLPKSEMEFESEVTADAQPEWKKYVRAVKITGLSIPPDGFLYIRWSGEDTSPSGQGLRDAIAIDDITIAFNPDAEFSGGTFEGTIHSGILAANAQLSDSATIVDSLILQDGAVLSTGAHALTLGPDVTLDETDGYIKGNLLVSRVIEAGVPQTFGGIGLSIETEVEAGLTEVKRVTGQIVPASNLPSILRYFEISPENNNDLDATVEFTFEDFELPPGYTPDETNFRLFSRPIGSTGSWEELEEGTLEENTYTVTGINIFDIQLTGADPNAPLPLDWTSFEVSHNKGYNLLKWVTANEVNTSSFDIEKSYDGKVFESVSTIAARGGSFSETYEFRDKHDRSGIIYYRIRQIDHDLKFAYSPLRSIRGYALQKLEVYPTMVSDQIMIFSESEMDARISIVNTQGSVVKFFELPLSAGDQQLPIHDLVSGVYWIRIENKEISESFRIVKQ